MGYKLETPKVFTKKIAFFEDENNVHEEHEKYTVDIKNIKKYIKLDDDKYSGDSSLHDSDELSYL